EACLSSEACPSSPCRDLLPAGGEKGMRPGLPPHREQEEWNNRAPVPPSPRLRGEGPGRGMRGQAEGIEPACGTPITPTSRRQMRGWHFHRRLAQMPPDGDWRVWLLMGGRGSGKTRAGAEWVHAIASLKADLRIA